MADATGTGDRLIVNQAAPARYLRIFATPDGESHLEERAIPTSAPMQPLVGITATSFSPSAASWHIVNRRQFVINLTGELDVEVSDGTRRRVGPGDLILLEDTHGRGHYTRLHEPVTCLFIELADDFDADTWSAVI